MHPDWKIAPPQSLTCGNPQTRCRIVRGSFTWKGGEFGPKPVQVKVADWIIGFGGHAETPDGHKQASTVQP